MARALRDFESWLDEAIQRAYSNGFEDGQDYAQESPPERNPEPDE